MPRYVLLRHECPPDYRDGPHWDLMLEYAGVLRTWSLLTLPSAWADGVGEAEVRADRLPDHRIAYLDYEGEVSGNRGHVKRIGTGEFQWQIDEADRVEVTTTGDLVGEWQLERLDADRWRLSIG
ncbi:MAG: DNA polymerase ligase N-terminal domain-containing protein [Planctomycetota bacterium]